MALPVIFSAMSRSSYPQLITKKIFYCLSKLWYNILSHYIIQYRTVIITRIYEYAVPVHLGLYLWKYEQTDSKHFLKQIEGNQARNLCQKTPQKIEGLASVVADAAKQLCRAILQYESKSRRNANHKIIFYKYFVVITDKKNVSIH